MWQRGRGCAPPWGQSPSGRGHRPLAQGSRQPRAQGKNRDQGKKKKKNGIRKSALGCPPLPAATPCTTHGFRKGSFGKHLQTYGAFLSQDFFNSLCFLVFLLEGGVWRGVLGGVWFLFCLGGGGGCRLLLQKAWLGKKTKRGGPSGGIKSTAKQLVPNSCPLQRD